jgi:hypothetical protein
MSSWFRRGKPWFRSSGSAYRAWGSKWTSSMSARTSALLIMMSAFVDTPLSTRRAFWSNSDQATRVSWLGGQRRLAHHAKFSRWILSDRANPTAGGRRTFQRTREAAWGADPDLHEASFETTHRDTRLFNSRSRNRSLAESSGSLTAAHLTQELQRSATSGITWPISIAWLAGTS